MKNTNNKDGLIIVMNLVDMGIINSISQAGRVFDTEGNAPTIVCSGGGYRVPMIAIYGETNEKESGFIAEDNDR